MSPDTYSIFYDNMTLNGNDAYDTICVGRQAELCATNFKFFYAEELFDDPSEVGGVLGMARQDMPMYFTNETNEDITIMSELDLQANVFSLRLSKGG